MTDFLVKIFVKDYEKKENPKVRTAYGMLAGVVGIICNVLLFGTKLAIGLIINSISVMADAFNNLSDAASSIVGLVGIKLAERPADKEHPFGHGRFEYIAAFAVSFLILQVGISCFKSAFSKILNPEAIKFQWILVIILCLSVLVKLWLSVFNKKLGERIQSGVMKATAADALGDVLVTSTTIVSILIGKFTGLLIDGWMGLVVSVFVLIAGYKIAKETLEPLLGEAVGRETYEAITSKVEGYEGIIGSHDLIVHNYGPSNIMATIHAEVPNDVKLESAHETIDKIERDVLREMGIFLVIHMDPVEVNDARILDRKKEVTQVIKRLEPEAAIHDFRIVNGDHRINMIFDMVVPYSYNKSQEEKLLEHIKEEIIKIDDRYQVVITIENSFIAD